MNIIILAGGYATRLYPLTKNFPKPLLPINKKTILDYLVEKIFQLDNIDKIILSINAKFYTQFKNWIVKNKLQEKIILEVEQTFTNDEKLGAVRALSKIYKKYGFNDYLIFGGDNLFTSELNDFVDYFKKQKSPITAVFQSTQDMELKNFGTLYLDPTGKIIQFAEKSENPQSNLIATCIYAIPNSSMNLIDKYLEGNNPDSPGYFIEWLSKIQNVFGFKLSGTWWDIGTLQAYTRIQEAFKAYYDTS